MITVMGLGFVGLTTALGFSEKGFKVYGYDIKPSLVDCLQQNHIPFYEPNLQNMLQKHINNNFILANSVVEAISQSKVIILCVGTPSDDKGQADLTALKTAIQSILSVITKSDSRQERKILVIKSTIPPTTTQQILIPFIEKQGFKIGQHIEIVNNPEFLREGFSWEDFIKPDRIIIGSETEYSKDVIKELYSAFDAPVYIVNFNTAEFIKYLSNTLLATMISFANELSLIAHTLKQIDIPTAFKILHQDKRWFGNPANMISYVYPGCGFGGYCLPKDTQALIAKAEEFHYDPLLLKSVLSVNEDVKDFLIQLIEGSVKKDEKIALLGLSFKPNSDDVRQSQAKDFIEKLLARSYAHITAYDPIATTAFQREWDFPIHYAMSLEEAVTNADAILILTAWQGFKEIKNSWPNKRLYDFRYFL